MLFIGDIHITSKHSQGILDQIAQYIERYVQEQHIIFLGDYVYHFAYDRKALLQLGAFFIELAKQGKTLYILAGNHDRLADHFVFEEAKQVANFMGSAHLHFITEPTEYTIEGIDCLFFPFFYPENYALTHDQFPALKDTNHPQRQLSRYINNCLYEKVTTRKQNNTNKRLLLIHHWYIAQTRFPGQQSMFTFSSPALDPRFLDDSVIWSISGHLHEAFAYKNYLCTGSVWHTSPLEYNQQKYLFQLNPNSREIHAHPVRYNPYIQLPVTSHPYSSEHIITYAQDIHDRLTTQLQQGNRTIQTDNLTVPHLHHTTLTLTSAEIGEDIVSEACTQELQRQLGGVKHKLISSLETTTIDDLERASLDLQYRFSDRKLLLRRFLEQKYGSRAPVYIELLEQEKLI